MKKHSSKRVLSATLIVCMAGFLVLALGLALSVSAHPAEAQAGYPVGTATVTVATTATVSGTATQVNTLAAPVATGSPTALVPVTGADLNQSAGPGIGVWIAIWLVGMLLVGFGLYSRLSKQ